MVNMPVVSDALKNRYCRGDWTGCARHQLIDQGIAVPEDLYPDDTVRAQRMIEDSGQPCPTDGHL